MTQKLGFNVPLPALARPTEGAAAVIATFTNAIGVLEKGATERGIIPIWDTLHIESERDEFDDRSFMDLASDANVRSINFLRVSVMAAYPEEVAA